MLFGINFFLYADLQYRNVRYELEGIDDDDLLDLSQLHKWQFWNPKMGVNWRIDQSRKLYLSAGIANREPTRADLKDAVKGGSRRVLPERLYDVELGYSVNKPKWMLALNLYDMEYHNQLIPTGKLNEVGYKLMSNVPYSYRRGMELSADIRPFSVLQLDANLSLSTNKVKDFSLISDPEKAIIQAYGAWGEKKNYGKTYMGLLRTTFVISADGIIEEVFPKVDTKKHAEQIIEALGI